MPGLLGKGARCWKCGKTVLLVTRLTHSGGRRATVDFHHHEDAKLWNEGLEPKPCVLEMSAEESDRAMRGEARDAGAQG